MLWTTAAAVTFASQAAPGQIARPRREWTLGMHTEAGWDSNVRFDSARIGDRMTRTGGALSMASHTERTGLTLTATANAILFDKLKEMNTLSYDVRGEATRRLTPKATGSVSASAERRFSSEMRLPGEDAAFPPVNSETALLPRVRALELRGRAGGEYLLSPATTGTIGGEYSHVSFDAPQLPSGSVAEVSGRLSRRYSPSSKGSFEAQAEQFLIAGGRFDVQAMAFGWSEEMGSLAVRGDAGVTRVGPSGDTAPTYAPYGLAELSRTTPSTTFMAGYTHRVSPSFGLGHLLLVDQLTVAAGARLAGAIRVRAAGSQAWSSAVDKSLENLVSSSAAAEIEHELRAGVNVGFRVTWHRRVQKDIATATEALLIVGYHRAVS